MGLTQVSTDGVKNDAITKTKIPANQIEASELADNAVDTNAIANNAVTAGKLASGVTDLSNDTSPQLGGHLSANTFNIEMGDSAGTSSGRLNIGASQDLVLYHNGTDNFITAANGHLNIYGDGSNEIHIKGIYNEESIKVVPNGAVSLYYDNSEKVRTVTNGVNIYGGCFPNELKISDNEFIKVGTSDDIQIYHDATHSRIDNATGALYIRNNTGTYNGNPIQIQALATEDSIKCIPNGAVRLYYDDTEYASTLNTGFNIGLKARNSDYNHISTVGWALSDGWTKVVFDGNVAANTPLTIYNQNAAFNRYMAYFKFDGGIANFSSNNINLCDERVKKDFADVSSQWNNIKNIGLKHFRYQEDGSSDPLKIGVVAQQVETIYPDLIDETWPQGDANPNTGEGEFYKGVKEEQLLLYSVKALQEAITKIETLETKVAALEAA